MPKPLIPTTFEVDGAALRRTRMQAGLGIRELAERVPCDRSYISALENGLRSNVSPAKFRGICNALNLSHPGDILAAPTPQEASA